MADEETPKPEEPKAPEPEAPAPSRTDKIWGTLDDEQKELVFQMAQERQRQIENPPEPAKVPVEPKPEAKVESQEPLTRLSAQIEKLEARLTARDAEDKKKVELAKQHQEATEAQRRYEGALDGVLDSDEGMKDDKNEREDAKEAYAGHWLKHRPQDVAGSFRRFLDRRKERDEKRAETRKEAYVQGKITTAHRTRGETAAASAAAAKAEYEPTAVDFNTGELDEKVKAKYSLT